LRVSDWKHFDGDRELTIANVNHLIANSPINPRSEIHNPK